MKTVASLVSSCLCFSVGWIMDMQISKQVEASKWSLNAIMTTRTSHSSWPYWYFTKCFLNLTKGNRNGYFVLPLLPVPLWKEDHWEAKTNQCPIFWKKLWHVSSHYCSHQPSACFIIFFMLPCYKQALLVALGSLNSLSSFIYLWRSKLPEMLVSSAIPGHFPHHYHCNRHLCHHHLLLGSPTKEFSSKSSSSRLWSLPSLSGSFGFRDILQIWLRLWWCHHYD